MAAYAALLSLTNTIKHIQDHPRPPISLDKKHVDFLTQNLTFLQDFLEGYPSGGSKEEDDLESRIADAAYKAEDVIDSHIVDQIHGQGEEISSVDFYDRLQKVIQDMDLIKKDVMDIIRGKARAKDRLRRNSSVSTGSARPASMGQNNIMVDFGDVWDEVRGKLIGEPASLQIIPIAGMGGIGKTTLARNIYENSLIVRNFDIRAWVTISQEYSRKEILRSLCQEILQNLCQDDQMCEDKLGETLYKTLCGRKYLIVLDDMWSSEAWDQVKFFFPNNDNESKIMITTRMSNLASQLSGSNVCQMKFLDEDKSWNLLYQIVFGKESCPTELKDIGKEIAKNCRGLPLSIVVIGGLLIKCERTREAWKSVLENISSLINLENNELCLHILQMSYKELPVHLKPCFLYMGAFPEDREIRVRELIRIWVVEGFLKSNIDAKSLEEVAKEYFKELIDRNLILVHKLGWNGKVKLCKIHDLLRDLCLREAKKQRFLCVLRQQDGNIPQDLNVERRIFIHKETLGQYSPRILAAVESASLTRLLMISHFDDASLSCRSKFLRVYSRRFLVFDRGESIPTEAMFQQANLRYLSFKVRNRALSRFPSSFSLLWNLQTLIIDSANVYFYPMEAIIAPFDIWKMPQLRHVMMTAGLQLPECPSQEDIVLGNLQTLSHICNFGWSEVVVKRIPKIKKLRLYYDRTEEEELPKYGLNNFGLLQDLESFGLTFYGVRNRGEILRSHLVQNLTFPNSLKKLTLRETNLEWEDLNTKIGSLPNLEILKLEKKSCKGAKWETIEGQFQKLKFLEISLCSDLMYWTTRNTHFPSLEHLYLRDFSKLEEIPSVIGDISTLQSIRLEYCSQSAGKSAERIKEEQEVFDHVLKVHVVPIASVYHKFFQNYKVRES